MDTGRSAGLAPAELDQLRERLLALLAGVGIRMDHPVVLARLADAGAAVDRSSRRVRFPAAVLERLLATAPRTVRLAGADPVHDRVAPTPDGTFLVRPNTGAPFWLEPETGRRRRVRLADVAGWAALLDALPGIDVVASPSPADAPAATADVHAVRCVLERTRKHVWVQPYSQATVAPLVELVAAASGGEAALRARPRASFITCSLTPLDVKAMDLEVLLQACPRGLPVHACSLPAAGTTAPVTVPGVALLAAAEIVALVAAAQAIHPGAPVVATPLVFATDMATGAALQSSVEAIQGKAMAVALLRHVLPAPTHSYGFGSDSPVVDAQSVAESALVGSALARAGCDILGGAGQVAVATTVSPLQLVIDEELGGLVRRLVARPALDDDALAWAELLAAEPGGQFLTTPHTYRHCRDAYRSGLLTRETREAWERGGGADLLARARARLLAVEAAPAAPTLPGEVTEALASVVRAADAALAA